MAVTAFSGRLAGRWWSPPWALWAVVFTAVVLAVAGAAYLGGPNVAIVVPDAAVVAVQPPAAPHRGSASAAAPVIVVNPVHPVEVYEPTDSSPRTVATGAGPVESKDTSWGSEAGSADEQSVGLVPVAAASSGTTATSTPLPTTVSPPDSTTTTTTTARPDDGKWSKDDGANRTTSGTARVDK